MRVSIFYLYCSRSVVQVQSPRQVPPEAAPRGLCPACLARSVPALDQGDGGALRPRLPSTSSLGPPQWLLQGEGSWGSLGTCRPSWHSHTLRLCMLGRPPMCLTVEGGLSLPGAWRPGELQGLTPPLRLEGYFT